jgi:hypothetical protein
MGTEPQRKVSLSLVSQASVKADHVAGIVPVKRLLSRPRCSRFVKLPRLAGNVPFSWFEST